MQRVIPNYYHKFRCIADKCKHSCCIGWEIAIDKDTLKYYTNVEGNLGKKLRNGISSEGTFVLDDNKRCPFLNSNGLCDIITELGDAALCSICREHPRFYNCYCDFCEVGLGMCCEHAAEIILSSAEPFCLEYPQNISYTEQEKYFLTLRQKAFSIVQNRSMSFLCRIKELCEEYGFGLEDISVKELTRLHLSMERLNDEWTGYLNLLSDFEFDVCIFEEKAFELAFEQLLCYMIFRHYTMEKGDYYEAICLSVSACCIIGALCSMHKIKHNSLENSDIANYARMYSEEVEYSKDNTEMLIEYFR